MKKQILAFLILLSISCRESVPQNQVSKEAWEWKELEVTATAYNSLPVQTSRIHPGITAWGDSLKPGKRYIAVSRDLIIKGLKHNTMVRLDTFQGIYLVKDKMNKRWLKRIDIYMGEDVQKALQWGKRKIKIWYAVPKDTAALLK